MLKKGILLLTIVILISTYPIKNALASPQETTTNDNDIKPSSRYDLPQGFSWKTGRVGFIDKNTKIVGYSDGFSLIVCHVNYLGGVHPGQLSSEGCLISYRGIAILFDNYEVLTSENNAQISWYPVNPENINTSSLPTPAAFTLIVGGHEGADQHELYICRALYKGIHLGKVVANNCNISADGLEVKVPSYEVLGILNSEPTNKSM